MKIIFLLRYLMKKYIKANIDLDLIIIPREGKYDRIPT